MTSLVDAASETFLYINGSWQNGHPYDFFHILIGLLPTLMHERPERGLAVGLGIGSTAYSMAQDPRLGRVDCVEICGGEKRLIAKLAERGSLTSRRLVEDPRMHLIDGDGRRWLLARRRALRRDRRRRGAAQHGLRRQSLLDRVLRAGREPARRRRPVRAVDSHRARPQQRAAGVPLRRDHGEVPDYFGSSFLVASEERLDLDGNKLRARFAATDLTQSFSPHQIERLQAFFDQVRFERQPYRRIKNLGDDAFNHDLFPRDEYFLNNEW